MPVESTAAAGLAASLSSGRAGAALSFVRDQANAEQAVAAQVEAGAENARQAASDPGPGVGERVDRTA